MTIDEQFKEIPQLMGVMRIQGENYIHFDLPVGFTIGALPDGLEVKGPEMREQINYTIFSSKVITFEGMIRIIEDMFKVNLERKQKQELLKATIYNIEKMFESTDLDDLKNVTETIANLKTSEDV